MKIMGMYELFGEEDILKNKHRTFSVSCYQAGELYAIKKE